MSVINTTYDTPSNYTYNSDDIEVVDGKAQLKLKESAPASFTQDMDNTTRDASTYEADKVTWTGTRVEKKLNDETGLTFNQPFDSDSGFTYDSLYTEFTGGLMRQIDKTPANSMSWATYTTDINLNYGGGTLTGTATGGATITGNKLDLTGGGVKYVDYDASSNASMQQQGAIKFKLIPNYTGVPASEQKFFCINHSPGYNANRIFLRFTLGHWRLQMYDLNGAFLLEAYLGYFEVTSGVKIEFEINFDITAGETRVFKNGVQFGATNTSTGVRDSNIGLLRIGSGMNGTENADYYIEDFVVYDTVQHTTDYTPGYTLDEYKYNGDLITYPAFTYSGTGTLQAFTNIIATQTGVNKFNVNGKYYSGGWVASDDSYVQMNTIAEILTNIATLPASDTVEIKQRTLDNNTTQMSISDFTLTYTGQQYLASNVELPELEYTGAGSLQVFDSFTTTDSGSPHWSLQIGRSGDYLYWDGAAWSISDGTYAQSNDSTTFNANVGSIDIEGEVYGQFKIHFDNSDTAMYVESLIASLSGQEYASTSPTIYKTAGNIINVLQLNSFVETLVSGTTGSAYYQLSDDGSTWNYWDGSTWTAAVGSTDYNTANEVSTNMRGYLGSGTKTIYVKAFLVSDTTQYVGIDNLTIRYVQSFYCNLIGYFSTCCTNTIMMIKRGNPYNLVILVKNHSDEINNDLSLADSIQFMVKTRKTDQNADSLILRDLTNGIAINSPSTGYITIDLESTDSNLSADQYYMALQINWGDDKEEIDLSFNDNIIDTVTIYQDIARS